MLARCQAAIAEKERTRAQRQERNCGARCGARTRSGSPAGGRSSWGRNGVPTTAASRQVRAPRKAERGVWLPCVVREGGNLACHSWRALMEMLEQPARARASWGTKSRAFRMS
jgi:hypothetical protein